MPSRRVVYRHAKKTLYHAFLKGWTGSRVALDRLIRALLRGRDRAYLLRLVRQRAFALAVAASVLIGTTAHATPPIELSAISMDANAGGFILEGAIANYSTGGSVSITGDVNGDGLDDMIIGAASAGTAGRAYVVFGKSSGTETDLTNLVSGLEGFVINGAGSGDGAGASVSGAGDVNGDGLEDLIVSAPGGGGSFQGEAYVVFGKSSSTAVELSSVAGGSGGFVIYGNSGGEYAGSGVSGAGDVNGDGLDDVLVGARYADPGLVNNAGRVYLIFGKGTTTQIDLASLGSAGFIMNGIDPSDSVGSALSDAGDVNGDGLDDIIIGAAAADQGVSFFAGEAYVVFGKTTTTNINLSSVAAGSGGFLIRGDGSYDVTGQTVSGAGDVNGDGLADVLVASGGGDAAGKVDAGNVAVVFGKTSGTAVDISDVYAGSDGFLIKGKAQFDRVGTTVSGAGDVDGDGLCDVVVASSFATPNAYAGLGQSYVVFGQNSGTQVELTTVIGGTGGFVVNGIAERDYAGNVSGAGDLDGDGLPDLVVGAPRTDEGAFVESGDAYVVFGPETVPGSATYLARSRAGDGGGSGIVPMTKLADARITIDYSDNDFGSNSIETVTLNRTNGAVSNFPGNSADVSWEVSTNRMNWTSADLTVISVDSERDGLSLSEGSLALFSASSAMGPWSKEVTTANGGNNTWSFNTGGTFSTVFVALGELTTSWADFAFGGSETGQELTPYNTFQEALENVADGGTVNIKGDTGTSSSSETLIISKPVTINAVNGSVRLGGP